jgi:hypothetical protein
MAEYSFKFHEMGYDGRQLMRPYGRKAMEWFSRKTSIGGIQISNWILVVAAVVVIWIIYRFIAH